MRRRSRERGKHAVQDILAILGSVLRSRADQTIRRRVVKQFLAATFCPGDAAKSSSLEKNVLLTACTRGLYVQKRLFPA